MPDIRIEPTEDLDYAVSVFSNPAILDGMADDSCKEIPIEGYYAAFKTIPGYFLKVVCNGAESGLFWLIRQGKGVEAHTALMPNCRGRDAMWATKAAIKWVFENDKAEFIRSYTWSDSPQVRWLCRAVGMTEGETNAWPNTRKGKPVDITYFTIVNPANA